MSNILTIYDQDYNGKTGKFKDTELFFGDKFNIGPCILDFENNFRIKINDITKSEKNLFYNNKLIDFNKYQIVIFNYGEDVIDVEINYIKFAKLLYKFITSNFPEIKIFNNPMNHNLICDTLITYEKLQYCKYVNIPEFGNLEVNNLNSINVFPCIISLRHQTGGDGKYLINNKNELKNFDCKLLDVPALNVSINQSNNSKCNKIFWAKFYNSKFKETDYNISIRMYIFNNQLIDFIARPSKDWNCHAKNADWQNKDLIYDVDNYFSKYFKDNKINIVLGTFYNFKNQYKNLVQLSSIKDIYTNVNNNKAETLIFLHLKDEFINLSFLKSYKINNYNIQICDTKTHDLQLNNNLAFELVIKIKKN